MKLLEQEALELERELRELRDHVVQLQRLFRELRGGLTKFKTLRGLIPICASCKRIRDEEGSWRQVEEYVCEHSGAEFSHGICPDCIKRLYPELARSPAPETDDRDQ